MESNVEHVIVLINQSMTLVYHDMVHSSLDGKEENVNPPLGVED